MEKNQRHLDSVATGHDRDERLVARRAALRDRQVHGVVKLMEQRTDLRGVHRFADFVDDAVRWTA